MEEEFASITSLASVGTEMNVRKSISPMSVKILTARPQKAATKGNQKGAEKIYLENGGLKTDVLTNI